MNAVLCLLSVLFSNIVPSMERPYNGGVLNPGSTLNMLWTSTLDKKVGAEFDGLQGVSVRVSEDGKKFFYRIDFRVKAQKDIKAFQVTAVVFDVFRRFKENWRTGRVVDLKAGEIAEGFFEKEVTIEEARLVGGSFLYIGTTISDKGSPFHFKIDPVFLKLKALIAGFKSSMVNL